MKADSKENKVVNAQENNIKLLTDKEVCQLMNIKRSTFYRYYSSKLTCYKNAENLKDRKHYFDKKEVTQLLCEKTKKPDKIIIKRTP